jgi:predicted GIY-YIG superfamily endonuclease
MRREIAGKAKADERTVKRVLCGLGEHNSAWARIAEAMAELGVLAPTWCVFGEHGEKEIVRSPDSRMGVVYVLTDPRDNTVRYVGCTTDPTRRMQQHLSHEGVGLKVEWTKEMHDRGIAVTMHIVEEIADAADGRAERRWMDFYEKHGGPILSVRPSTLPPLPSWAVPSLIHRVAGNASASPTTVRSVLRGEDSGRVKAARSRVLAALAREGVVLDGTPPRLVSVPPSPAQGGAL